MPLGMKKLETTFYLMNYEKDTKINSLFFRLPRAVLRKACKIIYKWNLAKSKKVPESWESQYSALFQNCKISLVSTLKGHKKCCCFFCPWMCGSV
jgi:hypothetical protein